MTGAVIRWPGSRVASKAYAVTPSQVVPTSQPADDVRQVVHAEQDPAIPVSPIRVTITGDERARQRPRAAGRKTSSIAPYATIEPSA